MVKVCKRHVNNPVMIYHQCVGCELEWFREELEQKQQEIERLQSEVSRLGLRDSLLEQLHAQIADYFGGEGGLAKLQDGVYALKAEIDRLREENEGRKKIIEAYMRIEHDLAEDAERYLQQRNKLIEGLRWYADEKNYRREFHSRHGTLVEPADVIYYDCGQRARNILKEIGVTVEPDRLHDARAKIAKARFSPERLLKEHQWRPIETAPRDGTTILVYDDGDVYQARWNEKYKYWEYADHEQFGCGCCSAEIDGATHWMPLPEPPRGVRG